METYRVVLTCWDYGDKAPFADFLARFFVSEELAREAIVNAVKDELEVLNDGREKVPVEDSDGKIVGYDYDFRSDENGNHANVVRFWDGDDYENVTAYDIYKLTSDTNELGECTYFKYRGFWILPFSRPGEKELLFRVEQHDVRVTTEKSLDAALSWIDDFHLAFEKDKGTVSRPAPLAEQIAQCEAQVVDRDAGRGIIDKGAR